MPHSQPGMTGGSASSGSLRHATRNASCAISSLTARSPVAVGDRADQTLVEAHQIGEVGDGRQ
jgi:hypothetical protein